MEDRYNRRVNYLRISVTDRCNLRCFYCMPQDGVCMKKHPEILRYEEIVRIVEEGVKLGISKVRITGGEPLVRPGIHELISDISKINGIQDISMTTNGILLKDKVKLLKEAGLNRVNISLDSLDPVKYGEITGGGDLDRVLQGINACLHEGLKPVKINVVLIKGKNDDEIEDLVHLTRVLPVSVRFIELMPIGNAWQWFNEYYISAEEVKTSIPGLIPDTSVKGSGPAENFRLPGAPGTVGFIAALSHNFCSNCNRIRLTADGKIKPCLNSDTEVDLRPALREDNGDLIKLLQWAISLKPKSHHMTDQQKDNGSRDMYQIGG